MPVNTWGPLILILVLPLHRCVLALYMFTQYFPKFCENQRVYGANTVMVKPKLIFISRTWICIKIGVYLHIFIYFCCKKPLLCWTFGVILCEMFVWYFCNILMINIWMFFYDSQENSFRPFLPNCLQCFVCFIWCFNAVYFPYRVR